MTKKSACGLCGETEKNLTQTPCCNNWICDDVHEYVLFSYDTNNCYRNHDRYTLCSHHYKANHTGKWQECKKCKNEFQLEDFVYFATNEFNFEKLASPPKINISCVNCGFESNRLQDFSFHTSNGWYCDKTKCQKAAMHENDPNAKTKAVIEKARKGESLEKTTLAKLSDEWDARL